MATVLASSGANTESLQPLEKDAGNTTPTSDFEKGLKPTQRLATRPTPLIWFLVCTGLYLGALLYGKRLLTSIAYD